ncbi:MAG: SDR family oxidoreductase [Chloroflexi bacterium]|nr:SDR family oxidoreductase [Chloroflexota bacterium]
MGGRLRNKVALIGGVGPGMGQAMAVLFAQEGAAVALMARRDDHLAGTAERIEQSGGRALACRGDTTHEADVQRAVAQTVATFGRLDIVVCNSGGQFEPTREFDQMDDAYFNRAITNHLITLLYLARHSRPIFRSQGGGAILTVAASESVRQEGNPAYGAGKGGVVGLTLNLAREFFPDNIRVNCVAPGLIRAPLANGNVAPVAGSTARTGRPEDVAFAALYLVSDEASWVTGQVLAVDGGVDAGARPLWQFER